MTKAEINEHVRTMAALGEWRDRQRYLNALIGPPVDMSDRPRAAAELQSRAMLVTKLNESGVWPPRG